jgi:hypothetical protein
MRHDNENIYQIVSFKWFSYSPYKSLGCFLWTNTIVMEKKYRVYTNDTRRMRTCLQALLFLEHKPIRLLMKITMRIVFSARILWEITYCFKRSLHMYESSLRWYGLGEKPQNTKLKEYCFTTSSWSRDNHVYIRVVTGRKAFTLKWIKISVCHKTWIVH